MLYIYTRIYYSIVINERDCTIFNIVPRQRQNEVVFGLVVDAYQVRVSVE